MDRLKQYARRFARVLDYIDRHLAEPLDIERLSAVAHFSRFHFHRQFSAYCGVSAARYILLQRLRRASFRLAFQPTQRIIDIAQDCGFDNPESFSRAFRQVFGQSPSGFRRQPDWVGWHAKMRPPVGEGVPNMEVKIVNTADIAVAALEHRGPPQRVNDSVARFIEWRKASGLSPIASSQTYGIAYDHPDATPPEAFRFDVCGSVAGEVPANPQGVIAKTITGGRCAVLRHAGSHQRLGEAVRWLYRQWLPASGEELRDFPVYFHYLNLSSQEPEHELLTDIYLPLR
ncbi:GyrI-like domain-containing protein [Chromobacterium sp. IIBBL 290-4]|uniref:AraC family transcriptional regulator n=1 Tax=Chromobacterium sp. IIBBL 290-4 TaxID=2953890 RepID=UPI0020B671C5|nr:AraC family transcriptional regulator [Chromobacterium sp. IIBBL 290-4]UTH76421.1 AraC family transcriptional regulator [Chromobacterium sp. IIBBL 290-4]